MLSRGILQLKKLEITQVSRFCADEKEFKCAVPDSLDDIVERAEAAENREMSLPVSMTAGGWVIRVCSLARLWGSLLQP